MWGSLEAEDRSGAQAQLVDRLGWWTPVTSCREAGIPKGWSREVKRATWQGQGLAWQPAGPPEACPRADGQLRS